jgi:hypothetical protein
MYSAIALAMSDHRGGELGLGSELKNKAEKLKIAHNLHFMASCLRFVSVGLSSDSVKRESPLQDAANARVGA